MHTPLEPIRGLTGAAFIAPVSDAAGVLPSDGPAMRRCLEAITEAFSEPRLIVHSVDNGEGVFFWDIRADARLDVSREIERLAGRTDVADSAFAAPFRDGRWWRAQGFTRELRK